MTMTNIKTQKDKTKIFVIRNSLLTDTFQNVHTRALYNLYIVVLITLTVQTAAKEYSTTGRITLGLEVIEAGFAKFDKALLIWLCCFASTCTSYFVFKVWSMCRRVSATNVSRLGGVSLVLYYFYTFKLVHEAVFYFKFNPPCVLFVTMETARLMMKVHSFMRNSASTSSSQLKFSNFLYFLFAPTLIYRDDYPRTKSIDCKFVVQRFLECVSVVFVFAFITKNIFPSPERWRHKFTVSEIFLLVVENTAYGALIMMGFSLLIFHSVQNLFAEVTHFGDRLFYLDWWNACNFGDCLTKWNRLVQDWLYYYIYRDFREFVWDNSLMAKVLVFLVSFAVHEWVAFCCVRGFMPFMYIVFMVVVLPLSFFKVPECMIFNILFWCCSMFLFTCNFVLYSFELYARLCDSVENPTVWELFVPRAFTSDCVIRYE